MIQVARKMVLAAYDLKAANLSDVAISKALGVPRETVRKWLRFPDRFDPYYDRTAVLRALAGDGMVYTALTHFERRLVVAMLERADTEEDSVTNRFPPEYQERVRVAIKRHREARGERRPKHHKIAAPKRNPEFDARVRALHARGVHGVLIAQEMGVSKQTVYRVLRDAA